MTTRIARRIALAVIAYSITSATFAIARDPHVRAEFRKANPCPSTGLHRGRCPGYMIDHRVALMLGGADSVANLQWLAQSEHRAKTRAEFAECKRSPSCKHRGILRKRARS